MYIIKQLIRLCARDFYRVIEKNQERIRANNLIVLVSMYKSFKTLPKSSSEALRKLKETAFILRTRIHCYATHYPS